jgi:hypothetical protein
VEGILGGAGMAEETAKAKSVWGRRSAEFFADLEGEEVTIAVITGQRFAGALIGLDTYDLLIRQASGLEMLITKGSVVYVHGRMAEVKEK